MRLDQLIEAVAPVQVLQPRAAVEITGVSLDSRRVQPGHIFVALAGTKTDGAAFARDAAEHGAAAVLAEQPRPLTALPQLVVADARAGCGRAARAFHGEPDRALRMGAITGTNGKTTTAYLVRHLLRCAGANCGMLGTVECDLGGATVEANMTTPDAPELFAHLRAMADNGCRACIMEVSSHSLCQNRTAGIAFLAAGFTNLTPEHLDYHRTMEAYRDAKALLFRQLSSDATAVLNLDDAAGRYYQGETRAQVLSCRITSRGPADLRARIKHMDTGGTRFEVESPWGVREVRWRLLGQHNVQNALAALGLALVLGDRADHAFTFDRALSALARFPGVPGRLQVVGDPKLPFSVLVDYAHTADALANVLTTLRNLHPSRLLVVFGAGGDRDRTKRPRMGKVVQDQADLAIVTSDNPRSEEPKAILAEICAGVANPRKFIVEEDRAKAIGLAIAEARPGDVVLIAGKGHENYQIIGSARRHFDDREQACAALERRFGRGVCAAASA